MQTLEKLNESFAIPDVLAFDEHSGLTRARITTPNCTGEIYLHGAHITAWQPSGTQPVLFLSERSAFAPDKAIRGGIPLVFPWFGARTPTHDNPRTDGPVHGFARTQTWQLDFAAYSDGDLHLSLSLAPTEFSRSLGFDHFRVAYQLVFGRQLHIRLAVANDGRTPLRIEDALHTYLFVADVERVSVHGLENTEYLDKTEKFRRKVQAESIMSLRGETDRIYLQTTSPVLVDDPDLQRRITVAKANSATTVVWNPGPALAANLPDMAPDGWRQMLCIESANAGDDAFTLHPHEAHVMETTLSVEALA